MDFNPFNATFAVGESNGIINIYDLRNDKNIPISTLTGHQLAVKEIKFSPFQQNLLCSCGFDMNINLWDVQYSLPIKCYKHHTEFVTGIDFSNYNQNIISSISFDKSAKHIPYLLAIIFISFTVIIQNPFLYLLVYCGSLTF